MVDVNVVESPEPVRRAAAADPVVAAAREALGDRAVWHVNTTAVGGGVAELLRSAVPRHINAGLDARWLVMDADQEFFAITKQLHHLFHGSPGHGLRLGEAEAAVYARSTREAADKALAVMKPGDVVLLHDPQTLGMAPALRRAGLRVAWRSHIGTSAPGPLVTAAWEFLAPFLAEPRRLVFSLPQYVPPGLGDRRAVIIAPSIDETSDKCRPMAADEVRGVLVAIGLLGGPAPGPDAIDADLARYARRRVTVWQDEPLPPDAPTVVQLSRWDPLKDMVGTLAAFVDHVAPAVPGARLVLAGPDPADIADDPENLEVFRATLGERAALPEAIRRRVHLVALGLADDTAEVRANALVVNALQRHASVVAQKSLREGFGLAVTEAMWKSRPVVGSAVGGIRLQMTHDVNGLLVEDPADLPGFGRQVVRLLTDPALCEALGRAAHDHCAEHYLATREFHDHLRVYVDLCAEPVTEAR